MGPAGEFPAGPIGLLPLRTVRPVPEYSLSGV